MEQWKGNKTVFRTYLKGGGEDGKQCLDKHKGIDHVRSWKEASVFPCFGAVLQPGYIDISFDNAKMAAAFLKMAESMNWRCLALENPENGHLHTYWKDRKDRKNIVKKDGKDKMLAVGLVADIHSGETYIPLRVNNVDRFPPVYDIFEDEEYQELPEELIPVNAKSELWNLRDGMGRNEEISSRAKYLVNNTSFSSDVVERIICNANEYVLADPLDYKELRIILRDETFEKELPSFYSGKTFQHDRFGDFLIEEAHVVKCDGQLHIYDSNQCCYHNDLNIISNRIRANVPGIRKSQKTEVLDYLLDMAPVKKEADPRYIQFQNVVLDIQTGLMQPLSPDLLISNVIPWCYYPEESEYISKSELAEHTLNKIACNDERIRKLLEECIGYCFFRRNTYNKAFILTGDKANGKSTFLKLLTVLLGEMNVSALDLKNLGDRFSKASLYKKLANIGDDISDDFIPDTSLFKKITDGGRIEAEHKGQKPFDFSPYAKLIFSANDIPRMKDKTGAVMRRLVIIPFNAKFSVSDPDYDPDILKKLSERKSIEHLIRLGVKGLKRIIDQKGFTQSEKVDAELQQYNLENNPVLGFISETDQADIVNQPTADVYRRYQVYCQENGLQPVSKITFSKQVNQELNTNTKPVNLKNNGVRKTFMCFVRKS